MAKDMREAFEAWGNSQNESGNPDRFKRKGDGYFFTTADIMWKAWQAEWNARSDRWMPIESAPKDGTLILAYQESSGGTGVVSWANSPGDGVWLIDAYGAGWMYPTHWMPLPQPPKTEE